MMPDGAIVHEQALSRYQRRANCADERDIRKEKLERQGYDRQALPRYPLAELVGNMPECYEVMATKAIIAGDAIELLRILTPYVDAVRHKGAQEYAAKRMNKLNEYEGE